VPAPRPRPHFARPLTAPPLVWAGVVVSLLACAAISASLLIAAGAERTSETAESFRRRLELLRIERDLVFATDRMEAAALLHLVTGEHADELGRTQAEFSRQLETTGGALEAFLAAGPPGGEAAGRLMGALASFRLRHPRPATAAESLRAASDLLEALGWVALAFPDGKWFDLCDLVHDLQIASSYGFDHADEYFAQWWQLTRPPTEPAVRAQIESLTAYLRALDSQSGDGTTTRWFVDRVLDLDRAQALDPALGELVAELRGRPGAATMRATAPFLLHRSSEPGPPPGRLYEEMTVYSGQLLDGAQRALELADRRIAAEVRRENRRGAAARAAALVFSLIAAAVLIGLELRRRRFNRHLHKLAETDGLTGLGNRYALDAYHRRHLADPRQGGFALIHLDLDNFKAINDSFGHQVGDRALTAFAACCRRAVRAGDTVARVGGDEFVIVLRGLADPEQGAREIAGRIHDALAEPVDLGGRRLRLQVSIGIATATGAADLEEMMVEADLALYAAKERGCNRHEVFADSLRRALVRDLPHALAHGGIGCAFQPMVDLATGEVVGLEALARWPAAWPADGPHAAAVPARKVIEVVEWLNETPALLRCMLARVEAAYEETRDLFAGRFWLNLSPADLAVSEAAETLIETFHAAAMPLDRLGVEVTESLPIVDFEQAVEVLERLRAAGLAVAIDDFGSGNTPLRHLTRLPLDVVKLDQEVTARVDSERSNRVLVSAVRFICEAHGMTLLAEGVETEREIGVLREMGVRQAQGYAITPPLALGELVEYLVRVQARPQTRPVPRPLRPRAS